MLDVASAVGGTRPPRPASRHDAARQQREAENQDNQDPGSEIRARLTNPEMGRADTRNLKRFRVQSRHPNLPVPGLVS